MTYKTDTGLLGEVSDDGKHGNASVLDLDVSEAVESLLVSVGDKSEGIEEAERRLGTEFVSEGAEASRRSLLLSGGESSGGGDEGGDNSGLHVEFVNLARDLCFKNPEP